MQRTTKTNSTRLIPLADTATRSGSRQAFNHAKLLALPAPPAAMGATAGMTTTTATESHFTRLTVAKWA
jgi:hypothetical protein